MWMCYVYENQMATDQLPPICWPFIAKAFIQLFIAPHILIKELFYTSLSIKLSNSNSLLSQSYTNQLFTHSTRAHILIKELSYPLLVIQSSNKNFLQSYPGTNYQVKSYLIHLSSANFSLQSRTNVMQFSLMTFHR